MSQDSLNGTLLANFRVQNALNWVQNMDNMNPYILVGKTDSWGSAETDPDFVAPAPQDNLDYFNEVWNDAIGAVRLDRSSVWLAIPRKDWGDPELGEEGLTFRVGDVVVVNSITGTNNHPQHGSGFIVYQCVAEPEGGTCSLSEFEDEQSCIENDGEWTPSPSPGGVDNIPRGTQESFDTGDGYKWGYRYTLPANIQATYVTDDWLIVPAVDDILDDPEGWGIEDVPTQGTDYRIPERVGARWVRVFSYIASGDFPDLIESGDSYRQISLVARPLVIPGETGTPAPATDDVYDISDLVEDSGTILYIENSAPITKTITQTEEIKMTFRF